MPLLLIFVFFEKLFILLSQVGGVYDEDAELGSQFRRRRDIEQKSLKCVDFDECDEKPCGEGGSCFNTHGHYHCECFKGYGGDSCEDIDECLRNPCNQGQNCENTVGSYECNCSEGFRKTTR